MNLSKKNNDEVVYNFGSTESCIDGVIRIDINDINKSSIVSMPSDNSVYRNFANKAFGKLLKMALNNEFPERTEYFS